MSKALATAGKNALATKGEKLAILIDNSSSMSAGIPDKIGVSTSLEMRIQAAVEAAQEIINASDPKVSKIAYLTFSDETKLWSDFTDDYLEILSNMSPDTECSTEMGIAINDVLSLGPNRIILLSDGQPNSRSDVETAIYNAKTLGVVIDTVGIGEADENLMDWIAKQTGGTFTLCKDKASLTAAFRQLETTLYLEHHPR